MALSTSALKGIRRAFDIVLAGLDKIKLTGALGVVWAWVAWSIKGVIASLWAFLTSPAVWLASILFFCGGWVAAFHLGKGPPTERVVTKTVVDTNALRVFEMQVTQLRGELGLAKSVSEQQQAKIKQLEANLAKPKMRPVARSAASAQTKPDDALTINWPKF